ncbi:unnamed protein product, partial [Amoebophrya sp. A25]|eukprot:GSA25T00027122001.1
MFDEETPQVIQENIIGGFLGKKYYRSSFFRHRSTTGTTGRSATRYEETPQGQQRATHGTMNTSTPVGATGTRPVGATGEEDRQHAGDVTPEGMQDASQSVGSTMSPPISAAFSPPERPGSGHTFSAKDAKALESGLKNLLACCVKEFLVEMWKEKAERDQRELLKRFAENVRKNLPGSPEVYTRTVTSQIDVPALVQGPSGKKERGTKKVQRKVQQLLFERRPVRHKKNETGEYVKSEESKTVIAMVELPATRRSSTIGIGPDAVFVGHVTTADEQARRPDGTILEDRSAFEKRFRRGQEIVCKQDAEGCGEANNRNKRFMLDPVVRKLIEGDHNAKMVGLSSSSSGSPPELQQHEQFLKRDHLFEPRSDIRMDEKNVLIWTPWNWGAADPAPSHLEFEEEEVNVDAANETLRLRVAEQAVQSSGFSSSPWSSKSRMIAYLGAGLGAE